MAALTISDVMVWLFRFSIDFDSILAKKSRFRFDSILGINPAFDCRVCSSPLHALCRRSGERRGGEEVRTGRPAWRPRVLLAVAASFDLHGRQFNVDGDVSRFSWLSSSETPFCWFNSGLFNTPRVPSPSSRLPPHPIWPITVSMLAPGSHSRILILHYDTGTTSREAVHLPRPPYAVRGLMRSYMTRLSGGLSPRVLLVQLQY